MAAGIGTIDRQLLDGWQRGLPLVSRPFAEIARALGLDEAGVLARLKRLVASGAISRVGATCRPNTVGASTLAAMAVPEWQLEEVAALAAAESGVNHVYQRENVWNLWLVATGPNRSHVSATLEHLRARTGLRLLDLPLVRPFNIDLGFSLSGFGGKTGAGVGAAGVGADIGAAIRTRSASAGRAPEQATGAMLRPGDREIMQALSTGLDLVAEPFAALARRLGVSEADVLARVCWLSDARLLTRVGIIVRHRALGWRANAMVVWQAPPEMIVRAGPALAAAPGVTLCYQRRPVERVWPYTLYCMIHGRSRAAALDLLAGATMAAGLGGVARKILFSTRCFKQVGALIAPAHESAA